MKMVKSLKFSQVKVQLILFLLAIIFAKPTPHLPYSINHASLTKLPIMVEINFSKTIGAIKNFNGLQGAPIQYVTTDTLADQDYIDLYEDLNVPYVRIIQDTVPGHITVQGHAQRSNYWDEILPHIEKAKQVGAKVVIEVGYHINGDDWTNKGFLSGKCPAAQSSAEFSAWKKNITTMLTTLLRDDLVDVVEFMNEPCGLGHCGRCETDPTALHYFNETLKAFLEAVETAEKNTGKNVEVWAPANPINGSFYGTRVVNETLDSFKNKIDAISIHSYDERKKPWIDYLIVKRIADIIQQKAPGTKLVVSETGMGGQNFPSASYVLAKQIYWQDLADAVIFYRGNRVADSACVNPATQDGKVKNCGLRESPLFYNNDTRRPVAKIMETFGYLEGLEKLDVKWGIATLAEPFEVDQNYNLLNSATACGFAAIAGKEYLFSYGNNKKVYYIPILLTNFECSDRPIEIKIRLSDQKILNIVDVALVFPMKLEGNNFRFDSSWNVTYGANTITLRKNKIANHEVYALTIFVGLNIPPVAITNV